MGRISPAPEVNAKSNYMTNLTFFVVQVAQAHEESATSVTLDNSFGPVLAFAIIILAIVAAKRVKKIKTVICQGYF